MVVWEGEIEPKESGVYHFKLFYGAYTKVFLDNKLVVEERWRPSWNPNSVKFTADLQAGKKVPVRIEWRGSRLLYRVESIVSSSGRRSRAIVYVVGDGK